MAFIPQYTITDKLLSYIKQINTLIIELNNRRFSKVVLMEFEKEARAVSTFASTSIEGNPLPITEVKKVLKAKPIHRRESEKEVLNYNQALLKLNSLIKNDKTGLSVELLLQIQKDVTAELLPDNESGYFRQEPILVNEPRTGDVVFIPPDVKDVLPLVEQLIDYVNINKNRAHKVDPLIVAGIFHKQMVIIHPFMDGNGRTARLATKLLLAEMGLDTFNLFSFENFYNKNVTKYFQKVGEFGDYYELADNINFTSWLEYFMEGIIDELLRVKKLLPKISATPETELKLHHKKILKHIQEKGFITDKKYAGLTDRAKATRALDFQKLIKLKLIKRKGKGRATHYVAAE
jgi:Fic family protein